MAVDTAALVTAAARFSRLAVALADDDCPRAIVRALSLLEEYGELRISEFARLDRCSQPAATALMAKLTRTGLAQRRTDPDDSRAVVVGLTPAGRDQLTRSRAAIGTALATYLDDVDPHRIEALTADITELYNALKRDDS